MILLATLAVAANLVYWGVVQAGVISAPELFDDIDRVIIGGFTVGNLAALGALIFFG